MAATAIPTMNRKPTTTPTAMGRTGVLEDEDEGDEFEVEELEDVLAEEVGSVERDVRAPNTSASVGFDQLGAVKLEL